MSARTDRRSWQLSPLPDLQVRRRGGAGVAVLSSQRKRLVLDALPSPHMHARRSTYTSHRPAAPSERPAVNEQATPDHVGSATIELVLDHVLASLIGAGDVGEKGRSTELLAVVGMAFVAAARNVALAGGSSADLAVLKPSGETLVVPDVDRHTVASLCDAISVDADDASALLEGAGLGLSHSAYWGVTSSLAPLRDGTVMALDLGSAVRTIHCGVGADGAEVMHKRTTATVTLAYASRQVGAISALSLLSEVKSLIQDEAWLRRQLVTTGRAR